MSHSRCSSAALFSCMLFVASVPHALAGQDPCAAGPECPVVRGTTVTTTMNVPYVPGGCAQSRRQCLNVFLPDEVAPCAPTVLWVHGGGWKVDNANFGKDSDFSLALGRAVAANGIPLVSCNYHLSSFDPCGGTGGSADHQETIGNVKSAVAWIRDPQNAFDLPTRIVVAGSSAGAHLAAMIATTQGPLETHYDPEPGDYSVCMAVLYSPPLNFVRMGCLGIPASPACVSACGDPGPECAMCHPYIRRGTIPPAYPCPDDAGSCFDSALQEAFLGRSWNSASVRIRSGGLTYGYDCNTYPQNPAMPTLNSWYDASPYFWVSGDEPPTFIVQARCDAWVAAAEGDEFRERMTSKGGSCEVFTYEPTSEGSCLDFECRHAAESFGGPGAIADQIRHLVETHLY